MSAPWLEDVRVCLLFYSRLPVELEHRPYRMPDFTRVTWAAPIAGGIIGAIAATVLLSASCVGLPTTVVAVLAVACLMLTTGALHEDGLADLADGFGGGVTRDQKLAIMRDSRVGTYGVLALVCSVMLRVAAISGALSHGAALAALVVISISAISRSAGLIPLVMLSPARQDGAGASAAPPSLSTLRKALIIGAAFCLAPLLAGASVAQSLLAIFAAVASAVSLSRLAGRQIGGYTGDVLGAAQQVAEISALICFSA